MKKLLLLAFAAGLLVTMSCKKESVSEQFRLLTAHEWTSDSLLVNKVDQSGPGQMLEKFKGDAVFNTDGTGSFGQFSGTWRFAHDETYVVIESEDLDVPISPEIILLTATELKVKTIYPNLVNPSEPLNIRMTFKAK
ncbi:MAG: hypothetical protein U0X39_12405 [Bacteroidales bacterium]